MRRFIPILLLLVPLICLSADNQTVFDFSAKGKLTAVVFYSQHCKACLEFKKDILPPIKEKYKDEVSWTMLNTDSRENLELLLSVAGQFEGKKARIPSVYVGNNFLVGTGELKEKLGGTIEAALKERVHSKIVLKDDLIRIFRNLSTFTIVMAGLIDGINPCAFAVIVFFVSFLAVYEYKKREVVCVGIAYCVAVFITYLLIGLGLFNFLYSLSHIYIVIKAFYYFVAALCFLLAGLAIYDYFKYKHGAATDELVLQLPKFLKKRINVAIGGRLRTRRERKVLSIVFSSLIVGFMVSLLEAVCTGQVYLPIIVSILKYPQLRARALTYLILYNLMFILPLVGVFILSLAGISSQKFNSFLKKHLGAIKVLMAVMFLSLGLFIIGYEHIYPFIKGFLIKLVSSSL